MSEPKTSVFVYCEACGKQTPLTGTPSEWVRISNRLEGAEGIDVACAHCGGALDLLFKIEDEKK